MGWGGACAGLPVGQRPSCRGAHFPGPAEALSVAGGDALGGGRIDLGQSLAKRLFAQPLQQRPAFSARLGRNGGDVGEALGQGPEIQTRAANHDGRASPLGDLREHRARGRQPTADRPRLRRVDDAEQVVWRDGFLVLAWPSGEDAQVAVDLHRVGVDDLAAVFPGEAQGQGRLAAAGGAADQPAPHLAHGRLLLIARL